MSESQTEWRGGQKSAQFAAAALREWLSTKLEEWHGWVPSANELPDDHDWNDVPLYDIAIRELERLGGLYD